MVSQKEIIEALRTAWQFDIANRIEAEGIAPPDGHIIVPTCAVRKKPYVPMTDDERLDISRGMRIRTAEVGQIEAAVIKRAGLNVANQCSYPDCLDNEDERCPKWLTGKCKRAGLEIKHD